MGERTMFAKINNRELYYEDYKSISSPVALYIHGGPGGIGGLDFSKYQGERLAQRCRVIVPDQRGVWRSQGIKDDENIELEDLIEDFEELRRLLHIEKWSIICHSFGGYLSVLYENRYPDVIQSIIFENPSFDFALSEYEMCNQAIRWLKMNKKEKLSIFYKDVLSNSKNYRDVSQLLADIGNEMGLNADDIMWHGKNTDIIGALAKGSKDGKENWMRSINMRLKILSDGRLYHSVFLKTGNIQKPCLLLKGKKDPITCEKQIKMLNEHAQSCRIVNFINSGHWIHIEEADRYADIVSSFLNENNR